MEDPRIQQAKEEAAQNQELVSTKYAFKGFGRSTEAADKVSKEAAEGQKLIAGVLWLVDAEENVKRLQQQGFSGKDLDSAYDALNWATQNFNKLKNEALGRRTKSIGEIQSFSQDLDLEGNDAIKLNKSTGKRLKLSDKIQEAYSDPKKAKDLDKVKSAGAKNQRVPILSKVPTMERVVSSRINNLNT